MHDSHPTAPLVNFPVVITWPVQWGDQDSFSHVSNTVYFRWFESGRIATDNISLQGGDIIIVPERGLFE